VAIYKVVMGCRRGDEVREEYTAYRRYPKDSLIKSLLNGPLPVSEWGDGSAKKYILGGGFLSGYL